MWYCEFKNNRYKRMITKARYDFLNTWNGKRNISVCVNEKRKNRKIKNIKKLNCHHQDTKFLGPACQTPRYLSIAIRTETLVSTTGSSEFWVKVVESPQSWNCGWLALILQIIHCWACRQVEVTRLNCFDGNISQSIVDLLEVVSVLELH